jgi:hypothetical protein
MLHSNEKGRIQNADHRSIEIYRNVVILIQISNNLLRRSSFVFFGERRWKTRLQREEERRNEFILRQAGGGAQLA